MPKAAKKVPARKVVAKKIAAKKVAAKKLPAKKVAAKKTAPVPASGTSGPQPTRFAHPFFRTKAAATADKSGATMIAHIQGKLNAIPPPSREPTFPLAAIIGQAGADEIAAASSIFFHTVGDTGRSANSPQGLVAQAMETDFDIAKPASSPAFFFHLGDVCYHPNKDAEYRPEFYEPYVHYPGKIVAIPGNHDGETFPTTDPVSLQAFLANFCAPSQIVPPIAGTIFRETMNQPGVFYLLDAPYVQIVALYSNSAENPGFISGAIPGDIQKQWLLTTLQGIAASRANGTRKALIIATHHPPFTAGGHSPSTDMLADIDGVCQQAGIMPDMHLAGHAHSYQRYTRAVTIAGKSMQIPYLVVGTGGIGDQAVPAATGQVTGDHTFVKSFQGYGYALVEVSATTITTTVFAVDQTTGKRTTFETFALDLKSSKVS